MFNNVELLIDLAYDKRELPFPSQTIGASMAGNPCHALLALTLRGFHDDPPSAHMARIFKLGHKLEDLVIADLREAGCLVLDRDELTGKQITYLGYGGHLKCKVDGHIEVPTGRPGEYEMVRLLEVKSMADANFKKFQKDGLKKAHPRYYAQCQIGMGLSGIRESLLVAYNKDNSTYHSEVVALDEFEYAALLVRVEFVLRGDATRISSDPDDWRCKGCFKRGACWTGFHRARSCKNCRHSKPKMMGGWHCQLFDRTALEMCAGWELFTPQEKKS